MTNCVIVNKEKLTLIFKMSILSLKRQQTAEEEENLLIEVFFLHTGGYGTREAAAGKEMLGLCIFNAQLGLSLLFSVNCFT